LSDQEVNEVPQPKTDPTLAVVYVVCPCQSKLPAIDRVRQALFDLATRLDLTTIRLRHDDIAVMAGVVRETCSKSLEKLQREGAVKLGRQKVHILDLDALKVLDNEKTPPEGGASPQLSDRKVTSTNSVSTERDARARPSSAAKSSASNLSVLDPARS